jgi:hypothetical protein
VWGGYGEVSADDSDECSEGDESVEVPIEGERGGTRDLILAGASAGEVIGAREKAPDHESESREGRERVVLLAIGDREEAEDDGGP